MGCLENYLEVIFKLNLSHIYINALIVTSMMLASKDKIFDSVIELTTENWLWTVKRSSQVSTLSLTLFISL